MVEGREEGNTPYTYEMVEKAQDLEKAWLFKKPNPLGFIGVWALLGFWIFFI